MSAVAEARRYPPATDLADHVAGSTSFGWWGMVWLIATEAMLFGALIASYFYLRFKTGVQWPPGEITKPTLELPLVMSAILWSSSIPVHMAERGIKRGNVRTLRVGLGIGFVLGAAFLGLQSVEYAEKLREFTPTTNAYGSLFFTITGFHGLHVLIGLHFNLWTQVRAWRGAFTQHRHVTVQNFTLYWHFVDAVWVFILATIYLSPNF
jgi:heme/copper-type cytochrome/quinol oxidase subunit 3